MPKKIEAPKWRPDAQIDPRGWVCPKRGELLVARKFTQEQIAEYSGEADVQTEREDTDNGNDVVQPVEETTSETETVVDEIVEGETPAADLVVEEAQDKEEE